MSSNLLSNRRNTRENLLMFFYSMEFKDTRNKISDAELRKFLGDISEIRREDKLENLRESIKEIFDSVKIIKLENDDSIEFTLPYTKESVSMTFEEMDSSNVYDGFLTKASELMAKIGISDDKKRDNPFSENSDNMKFFTSYVSCYFSNLDSTDKSIISNLENWDFGRISIIDKIILRMGIVELKYFNDIPPKVVINEAIELGKKYSTEKSNVFINGILNKLKNEIRKTDN
ncbi:MAG TPA: transcription antitermination factor NusB [Clostridiales bacterium]|nr:transcription antitermination factor NusB [Clostridiales bacterium]